MSYPEFAEDSGPLFVVTGANSGLGFETARNLASGYPNAMIVLGCRDPGRAEAARLAIEQQTGNAQVHAMNLDVSSMTSVRSFAVQLLTLSRPIEALVLNAGISRGPAETVDGLDGVFETNHLGHFLLTQLVLQRIAPRGRVIAVSSDMHQPPGPELRWPGAEAIAFPDRRSRAGAHRYSYSKLCNLYFVHELSRRQRSSDSGVEVAAFNPGLMTATNFATTPRPVAAIMSRIFASRVGDLASSGVALAQLAAGDTAADIDGHYFDRTAAAWTTSSELSYNAANALELWELSERLTSAFV